MTTASAEFFDDLHRRGHEPLLGSANGIVHVELRDEEGQVHRRVVTIEKGNVTVSGRGAKADCKLRTERVLFDDVVRGRANAMACVLRGAIDVDGDWGLLLLFQRLFPGPPGHGRHRRDGEEAS